MGDPMTEQELIDCYIESSPDGRADARLRGYGVNVWAVVGQLRIHEGCIDEVMKDYDIPRDAVQAALAYYGQNKDYIDARLLLNSA